MNTLYWYDLETWGLSPKYSSAAQFAGIRTDLDLNEIGESLMIYAKPRNDMLPEPGAILTTGITPQKAQQDGLIEKDFIARIYSELIKPGTITSGYNTIRFDDEMLRYMLYRNLYDPYEREYANGNNRWDILDLVRAMRALRPDGLDWPFVDSEPSNRLEEITKINNIEHEGAHDALVDVRATISLAKIIKQSQPELYSYAFSLIDKKKTNSVLQEALEKNSILVHSTGRFANKFLNTSLVAVLGKHPVQNNKYIVYDLRVNPQEFLQLSKQDLADRRFISLDDANTRLPIKEIGTNKSPFIASMDWFNTAVAARIQLDESVAQKHAALLTNDFKKKVISLFTANDFQPEPDVDAQLYDGFPSPADKRELERVRSTEPAQWGELLFENKKYASLAKRYLFRNFPNQLNEAQHQQWEQFRAQRLLQDGAAWQTFPQLEKQLLELAQKESTDQQQYLLEELKLYAQSLYPSVE
ncbi:TPA: exodeoxyribonuclease I [Candidatus Saccharibacteria bacterium]|nr:exodeoxyribonuclease I [Candidatus Saccharibacteria bacterium]HIO87635.1 exodeoxyribonuclease I [Candidatus Saccharibacteria bacterium]